MNESDYRAVLAERVKAARRRQYKTVDKARQAADIARGTWEKVEKGIRVMDFSYAAVEEALHWPDGYIEQILSGHDPDRRGLSEALGVEDEPQPQARPSGLDAYLAAIEDRLDDLEQRMAIMENPYLAGLATSARYNALKIETQRQRRRLEERRVEGANKAEERARREIEQDPDYQQDEREAGRAATRRQQEDRQPSAASDDGERDDTAG